MIIGGSGDAIFGATPEALVTSWNAAAERAGARARVFWSPRARRGILVASNIGYVLANTFAIAASYAFRTAANPPAPTASTTSATGSPCSTGARRR